MVTVQLPGRTIQGHRGGALRPLCIWDSMRNQQFTRFALFDQGREPTLEGSLPAVGPASSACAGQLGRPGETFRGPAPARRRPRQQQRRER